MNASLAGQPVRRAATASAALPLLVIVLMNVLSYVDRSLVSVLQVPIKHDLKLSDAELGALTGLAFAIVYSTIGIPISRLADRSIRKRLIAIAIGGWSIMTGLSGLAANYLMLVIFRMGLALGESVCGPAAYSLIGDIFPRERRGLPMAVLATTMPIGTMIGMAAAGWISQAMGWRYAFVWIGAAGLVLVLPLVLLMREPERGRFDAPAAAAADLTLGEATAAILGSPAMRLLFIASTFQSLTTTALATWGAPFYARTFGMGLAQIGFILGIGFGLVGGCAALLAGYVSDRLSRRKVIWYGRFPALCTAALVPLGLIQLLAPDRTVSLVFGACAACCSYMYLPPLNVALQALAAPRLRALTAAILTFLGGAVGYGLGPLGVGLLSDQFTRMGFGQDALRYALALSLCCPLVASLLFWRAGRHIADELPPIMPTGVSAI